MADREIYTRVYSRGSARQLVSGKGPNGDPLSNAELLEEFSNHSRDWNTEPTALVSCSNRIVDTVTRAFRKQHKGESPADICIAFIEISSKRSKDTTKVHSAKALAETCKLLDPHMFSYEFVFEWAVPEERVIHEVSLQTLMNGGFQARHFLQAGAKEVESTMEARKNFARELQQHDSWGIGAYLGVFAQNFGARAPLYWISRQLFYDCAGVRILDDEIVRLSFAHGYTEIVDFEFFIEMDDGINTSLYDWWLSDPEFLLDCEEYEEWRAEIEDDINYDLSEFLWTWHDVDFDGVVKELSAEQKLVYDEVEKELFVEHERKRAAIRAVAVEIGL